MPTAQGLITSVLRNVAALPSGQSPTSDESNDAFERLNQIVSSISNEEEMVYTFGHVSHTATSASNVYTLGSGGSIFTATRPFRITGAHATFGNFSRGLDVLPLQEFRRRVTNEQGRRVDLPELFGADSGAPLITLEIFPTLNTSCTLRLDYWQALTQIASLGTTLTFPEGYDLYLFHELQIKLAPEYGYPVTDAMILERDRAKNAIARPKPVAVPAQ